MMKHLFTTFLALLATLGCCHWAQAQNAMIITKNDGSQIAIRVSEIHDVTFGDDALLQVNMPYEVFWLKPDQWVQLDAYCTDDAGEDVYAPITWKSTDEAVATVDRYGAVTAVGDGSCQILAVTDKGQGSLTINVTTETMLDIRLDQIGNRSCKYTITPANNELRYYSLLRVQSGEYSVDGMVQHGSEEQNIYHFALDWWDFCAELYNMTWQEVMNQIGLDKGITTEVGEDLKPGTEYNISAFAMNADGTMASPVEVKKFYTTTPTRTDMTFEVTMGNITSNDATFTIMPSSDDPYFVNVQRASYVDWFVERGLEETEMVQSLVENVKPSVYPEAYCRGQVTRSATDYLTSLRKDEDYYVIVFGFDDGLTSAVSLTKFHTLP